MEPISFLDGITGYVRSSSNTSADRPIRIATIDPAYNGFASPYPDGIPSARVTFEGETILSGKSYPVASGYIPMPSARVFLVPIGNTYLIVGAVTGYSGQGFYANPAGTDVGIEFGDGSYFDATGGLVLLTDAEVQGDLTVGGIGAYLHKYRTTDGAGVVNSTTPVSDSVLFHDLSVGIWELHAHVSYTATGSDMRSAWVFTGTWSGVKFGHGVSPYTIGTTTPAATNDRQSAPARNSAHGLTEQVPYGANDAGAGAVLHEHATVNVTVAGRWTFQHAQGILTAGQQTLLRTGSFITARKVG